MKHPLSIVIATLALAALACNPLIRLPLGGLTTIPTATFSIDPAIPAGTATTEAALTLAPGSATLTLAGGAERLAQGEIHYNVAEWQPSVVTDQGRLRIEQHLPDDIIANPPAGALNQWNLKLSDTVMRVQVVYPAGDLTLDFADTLPDGVSISVTVGAANLRLIIPAGVAADVQVRRGPSGLTTEGAWTADGDRYTTTGPGPKWAIDIEMGVGHLTLTS
jgi:hypothetical protein